MKTVFRYYKPYIWLIALILAFLFGQAMCELALPGYMSDIINNGIVKQDMDYIWKTGLIMLAVSAGTVLCSLAGSFFGFQSISEVVQRYKEGIVQKGNGVFGCGAGRFFYSISDNAFNQ